MRSSGGSSMPFLTLEQCLAHPQASAVELRERAVDGLPWRSENVGDAPARPAGGDGRRPLGGVRVVDLGVGGVGPFAATLLGWLGADVVKIEAPNEFIMSVRPTVAGVSSTYFAINQGKRSVRLDLKQQGELQIARRLIAGADVVLENFRPGALDRLGLGFSDVLAFNPAIVYCSATGFGWDGPLSGEPCTDPHMQAFSGFAWANADSGVPRRVRYYGFVDLVTSCVIAEAVCAALVGRMRTGGATRIETSMLHAVVAAQTAVSESHGRRRHLPDARRRGRRHVPLGGRVGDALRRARISGGTDEGNTLRDVPGGTDAAGTRFATYPAARTRAGCSPRSWRPRPRRPG